MASIPDLATYTGGGVNAPALLIPSIPLRNGTIEKVRVVYPDGSSDGDSVFQFLIDDVDQTLSLTIPDGDDEIDDDGLSIATTEDNKGSLRIIAPMPTAMPVSPVNVYIYYAETHVDLTTAQTIAGNKTPTGAWDFGGATSLELPNSAAPTVNADGEIAVDTTVADFSHGIPKVYAGEELGIVVMPVAEFTSPTNGHVVAYNATNDEFELVAQSGGGSVPFTAASASGAATLEFAEDTDNGTNKVTLQGPASTADVTVTLPAATGTIVLKDSTDTLTNKTIDANGTGNSISNLEVADFAASAIVTAADTIAGNDNDTTIPTSAAVKDYADSVAGGNSFGKIAVSGQSDVDADTSADTLTLVAGTNVTITTNAGTDEVTISASLSGGAVDTANSPNAGEWAKFTDADTIEGRTNSELLGDLGITSSVAELNILDGVTASAAELNALDGITATVTELNYTDGVTSAIQTQLDAKLASSATSIGKQTIYIPASAMIAATTSGPASAQQESSTNDINYQTLAFDASADEHAHFNVAFPKSWNLGTITYQVFWTSTATDTDGVAWGLQGLALSDNEVIDASWGTPIVVTDDLQGAAGEMLVTAESSVVTIAGTPADDDLCMFRIFRDVSDANDDATEDALLIGVKLFYTTDAGTDA